MNPMPHEVQAAVERLRRIESCETWKVVYPSAHHGEWNSYIDHDMEIVANYALTILPSGPRPEAFCQGDPCVHQGWCIIDGKATECPTDDFQQDSWHTLAVPFYSSKEKALNARKHDLFDAYVRETAVIRERLEVSQNRKETR